MSRLEDEKHLEIREPFSSPDQSLSFSSVGLISCGFNAQEEEERKGVPRFSPLLILS